MLRLKIILQYSFIYIAFLFISIIISYFRTNINTQSKYNIEEKEFTGILTNYKVDGDKFSFEIKGKEKLKCTYFIKTEEEKNTLENLKLGITLKLNGTLSVPMNNTIPNTFSYKKYLKHNNINYILAVDNYEVINNKENILYKIKNAINTHISKYKSKGYLSTFITGDKTYLDDQAMANYQTLGVSHIFAISGMHVSLLSTIILWLLKRVGLKNRHAYILVITFLIFYMFVTNFQASILRSVGLFILLFINRELDFNIEVINILYLDIAILLLVNPYLLYNVGFLYSSIVSYSLIKYSKLIKGNYLVCILKVSLIAFLFSLPITLVNNYEINILSVLNNLIIVPLVSLLLYPLSLLTFIFKPLDSILFFITSILEVVSNKLLVLNIIIPKINWLFIGIYYLLITLFFKSYNKGFLLLTFGLIIITKYFNYIDQSYYVYFLDVSQGDSIVIKKGNKCIMIDTGGKVGYEKEEWQVREEYLYTDNTIKFLKSIGINDIDYLILSHGDYDHMGEAVNLVKKFKVKNVIFNNDNLNNLETELISLLNKKKINYYQNLKKINIDKNKLKFLSTKNYDNENDNSNVIYFSTYDYKLLFMGDAGVDKEKYIIEKYNIKDIDILKVGHHGSKTSSGSIFINTINPKYSVISVGRNNRYGHPNKEVLNNLKDSEIYRTDLDGSIMFKIKKNKLIIKTFAP